MNREILNHLILTWELQSQNPETEDGSEQAKLEVARREGRRDGIRQCTNDLKLLLSVFKEIPE